MKVLNIYQMLYGTNSSAIATNSTAIATNSAAIATINYDISEIPVLLGITDINTHGDQYGENGEIWKSNGFDTVDYSQITINLPATTFYFNTTFNNVATTFYTVKTPSADNQIVKYRFQIPVSVKINGTAVSAGQDVNVAFTVPTQYYAIKNGDEFNPIVGNITSYMGGDNSPKSMDTLASGAWNAELYLYTLFIEFEPVGAVANDEYEIFAILPFSCYSFGSANPNRPIIPYLYICRIYKGNKLYIYK
jgi:hypothetical protein